MLDLLVGQGFAAQILLHQGIVALGGRIHHFLAAVGGLVGKLGGDFFDLFAPVFALVNLHLQEVNRAFEVGLGAHRQFAEHDPRPVAPVQGLDEAFVVGVVALQFVDENALGQVVALGGFPGQVEPHVEVGFGFAHDDDTVHYPAGRFQFTHKVRESGHINQVDFVVVPLQGQNGQVDAVMAVDLLAIEITL